MKTKIVIFLVILTFAMIRPYGQYDAVATTTAPVKMNMSKPPTYETKLSGLDVKVWVMTQEEHMKMMEGTKTKKKMDDSKDMSMNQQAQNSAMSGTHHIKVEVTDVASGQARNDLSAKVEVMAPSQESSWIDLRNMSDHYGSDLTLGEKGLYTFTINLDDHGTTKTTEFKYTVQ